MVEVRQFMNNLNKNAFSHVKKLYQHFKSVIVYLNFKAGSGKAVGK
jgi:hypothetical protein